MIKQVCITDSSGPKFYTHADFPLAIGSHPNADIRISSENSLKAAAFLLIIVNRTYIESDKDELKILINGEKVTGQKEIQHDDILQIEATTFHCEHIGDTLSISLNNEQSHLVTPSHEVAEHGELIEPVTVPITSPNKKPTNIFARFISYAGSIVVALLLLTIAYVFTAKTLLIIVEPIPDHVELSGKIWPIEIRGRYLVQPGEYELEITKPGYVPIQKNIKITKHQSQTLSFSLQKKPGFLTISSVPEEGVSVFIDDKDYNFTPISNLELAAGTYSLTAIANRYQPYSTQLIIEGKEKYQKLNIELLPNWSEVKINSDPPNAVVWINGERKGLTELSLDLLAGKYNLELRHQDYMPYTTDFIVIENEPLQLPLAMLFSSPSHLVITSAPSKASVSITDVEKGITPLTIRLNPNTEHTLILSKPGFRANHKVVTLKPGEQQTLFEELEAILGTVILNVEPKDSEVFVNGKFVGNGGELKISLPSAPQRLEIRKSGYEVIEKMVTPSNNAPKVINVSLSRITSATKIDKPTSIRTSQGQELKLIIGGIFPMGSSRREQGRRSNETLHNVELRRPFYISTTEITNSQFNKYIATHNSGSYKGNDLSAPNFPVVNISWEDAARYCNWLSEKDGLKKVYKEKNKTLVAITPLPSGYRLPTESEWAWVARVQSSGDTQKYGWGNSYPPESVYGNFADLSAATMLDQTITDYNDGFIAVAPVGKYKPNRYGIYDLDGNIAEWSHDYHSIYPSLSGEIFVDPIGPATGKKHVIRGASWMRGDISTTRLSYRDRDNIKRIDVGFRIAKYID